MSDSPRCAAFEHNGTPVSAERFYAIACDPRRSVAVEACAGAGKTWMLVSRIVRALLDGVDPQDGHLRVSPHEILAITFTKRAASEMRERLYQWLAQFAEAADDVLVTELQARGVYGVDEDPALSKASRRLSQLYQRVLESGRQVQVRTFHSWFAALLRAAPLAVLQQLELPLNYELLEDDGPATALVWRRFYQALVGDALHKADFEAVVLEHGRFQTEKALAVALDKRIEFALADSHGIVDASVEHFQKRFPALAQFHHPHDALEQPAARDRWLAWAHSLGRESNKTPQKAAQRVFDAFAPPANPLFTGEADGSSRLEILRKAFFVADEDRLTQHLKKYPAAQEAECELAVLCAASHQHEAWLYQQRMARLTRVLLAQYAALKRERGWVDMPDVERGAQILLSDSVLSGWVQERLDTQVKHLLIDEFQDTNPLQWQALMSWLGAYAGAGGHVPSVFIVGDPKQSIYRFRRAEPQVFLAAQEFVAQGLGGDLLSCDHTRRNATGVIETVNAVMANARAVDHYEGFREHTTSSTDSGRVCTLAPVPRPEALAHDELTTSEVWRDSLATPRESPEETLRTMEARQAAGWIAHQLSRGVQACDVMVLSRRRAGLLPMQEELRALRIPAQIGEKTALIDCCEVQDIVALLDVLVSNQHDLSLARALKSPLFGLSDDALIALALARKTQNLCWFELLGQTWAPGHELHGVGDILLRWKNWLDRLPPHDALQAIYSDGDVLARFAVAAPTVQRDTVLANLRALLAASLQLGGGRYATPYAFVRALKAGGVQAPASVNDAAVRLLTIHGAKGLEARAVVLLDTDTPERAGETMGVLVDWPGHAARPCKFVFLAREAHPPACAVATLEHEKTQRKREELNAMYVALTRARDTLVISSITPHRDTTGSWWQRLSGLIAERVAPTPTLAGRDLSLAAESVDFYLKELPVLPLNQILPTPSDGAADVLAPDEDTPLARVGKAMHRLLEWGDASEQNAAAAAREFGLDVEQGVRAAQQAGRVLAGKGAWVWDETLVGWQGNEVELMYQGEPYRLDRLVQRKDTGHWWVLDFKSAESPQQQPALVDQMHTYRAAVQQVYPGDTVRAAFLTASGELIELPPDAG
jgi:ATP-dependent helicase/nuclease subunit A